MLASIVLCFFFFFNDTATTEIYTLSLHDALPIYVVSMGVEILDRMERAVAKVRERLLRATTALNEAGIPYAVVGGRSEEHTSELQSPCNLVCRLLLAKKKNTRTMSTRPTSTSASP